MGDTLVNITVYGDRGYKVLENVLVDTGATNTIIDPESAKQIDVKVTGREEVDVKGKPVLLDRGFVKIEMNDKEDFVPIWITSIVSPVVGLTTLEILRFKVNPLTGRLEKALPRI